MFKIWIMKIYRKWERKGSPGGFLVRKGWSPGDVTGYAIGVAQLNEEKWTTGSPDGLFNF